MALNFGPPVIDFSPLGNLGKTFFDAQSAAQKRAIDQQKQQLLAGLGQGSGDFQKVGLGLIGAGDVQSGVALLGLAQKDREQKLQEEAYKTSPFSSSAAPQAPASPTVPLGSDPRASLIQNESGGRWNAQNDAVGAGGKVGHFGRLQFGQARLQEAKAAGVLPADVTPQAFMASPELQQRTEAWHFGDIDNAIKQNGYDQLVGRAQIAGAPVTIDGLRAVAHLGGKEGMRKFVETQGAYNPADVNGTRLSDYFARHGGSTPTRPAPVQVAENEADVARIEAQMPGYGAAPVQVAQAPAQPGAPVADAVAPGAQPAQGFVVPPGQAGKLPENDPFPQVTNEQLISVIRNPRSSPGDKALAQQLFASRQAYASETAPEKREQTRLETQKKALEIKKLERDVAGVLTPEQEAQKIRLAQAGRTQINNTNAFDAKGESKFNEALGSAQAKRWNSYIEEGDVAQGRLADIQTLRETSRRLGSQGSSANLKATIGPYAESLGIKVDGLPDIQLYESITNRLAPTLRAPGSGSTSDIEFKGFQRAIGPLSNNPAAREMILDTFEAASRNDVARAQIASRLASGEINRGDAEKELRALPNPLEAFRKFREANPDAVGEAIKEAGRKDAIEKRGPPTIASPEQALKLPSGTEFIDPNGVRRRVP